MGVGIEDRQLLLAAGWHFKLDDRGREYVFCESDIVEPPADAVYIGSAEFGLHVENERRYLAELEHELAEAVRYWVGARSELFKPEHRETIRQDVLQLVKDKITERAAKVAR